MNNPSPLDFIGTAITFPLQLDGNGRVVISNGWDVINASIRNILSFYKRYFLFQFGVGVGNFLEEPNDIVTENVLEYQISQQLSMFDNRVTLKDLKVEREEKKLTLTISVALTGTDLEKEITYPLSVDV